MDDADLLVVDMFARRPVDVPGERELYLEVLLPPERLSATEMTNGVANVVLRRNALISRTYP